MKFKIYLVVAVIFMSWIPGNLWAGKNEYSDSLKVWQNFFATTGFKYAYQSQNGDVGMGGSRVKRVVAEVPEALREVRTFGKFQIPSFILTLASGAALGIGLAAKSNGDDKTGNAFLIGGGIGLAVGITLDQVGYGHLKKGVRIFNHDQRK